MNENEYSFDQPSTAVPQADGAQSAAPRPPEVQYQAAPQPRPVYPYQQPYPQRPAYSYPQQTRTVRQEQPKKKRMTARIALVALCCAILGSLVGGGAVGLVMHRMYQKDQAAVANTAVTQTAEGIRQATDTPARPVSTGELKTPAQIYEENVGAVVGISGESTIYNAFGQRSETASSGTGFVVTADGEILTNYHVVEGAHTLTVTMYDGRTYDATVLGYEAESDIALLKIDARDLQTVTIGDSDALLIGDEVAAIGNPLGELTYSITVGYLSAKDRAVNADGTPINMMQIDAAINPGNSGGPLFDLNGNVIGITTAKYSGTMGTGASIEGIGFAIPINDALAILDDLRENGTVLNRAFIGINVSSVTAEQKQSGLPNGAYVVSVVSGGRGEKAGLQAGDVITAVDGTAVKDSNALTQALKSYRGGDRAVLAVWRGGKTVDLTIVFDSKDNQTAEPTESTAEPEVTTEYVDPFDYFPWGLLP
ncbi:MAG: trypsin-like peptidase domain-containing protein [Oscillospiraceae bacterium]|nr:trypsin-like peptidase domain-containing protein [Oscillospiraceae bacterium]